MIPSSICHGRNVYYIINILKITLRGNCKWLSKIVRLNKKHVHSTDHSWNWNHRSCSVCKSSTSCSSSCCSWNWAYRRLRYVTHMRLHSFNTDTMSYYTNKQYFYLRVFRCSWCIIRKILKCTQQTNAIWSCQNLDSIIIGRNSQETAILVKADSRACLRNMEGWKWAIANLQKILTINLEMVHLLEDLHQHQY